MAATALLKLAGFTNDVPYVDIAHNALAQMQPATGGGMLSQYPLGFGQWLRALSYALLKLREIATVGDPDSADTQALLSVVRSGYRPFQVVAVGHPGTETPAVPLLQDHGLIHGHAAAYLCNAPVPGRALPSPADLACQTPTTEPERLQAQLGQR